MRLELPGRCLKSLFLLNLGPFGPLGPFQDGGGGPLDSTPGQNKGGRTISNNVAKRSSIYTRNKRRWFEIEYPLTTLSISRSNRGTGANFKNADTRKRQYMYIHRHLYIWDTAMYAGGKEKYCHHLKPRISFSGKPWEWRRLPLFLPCTSKQTFHPYISVARNCVSDSIRRSNIFGICLLHSHSYFASAPSPSSWCLRKADRANDDVTGENILQWTTIWHASNRSATILTEAPWRLHPRKVSFLLDRKNTDVTRGTLLGDEHPDLLKLLFVFLRTTDIITLL